MKKKIKSSLKLILIWVVIIFSYVCFSTYQEIRKNKLFNYNDSYSSSEIQTKTEKGFDDQIRHIYKITANDDYLGSVTIRHLAMGDREGQVIFKVRSGDENNLYIENRYDFSYFKNEGEFSFGFPEIVTSKDKQYTFEFEAVPKISAPNLSFVDTTLSTKLSIKYVFPREIVSNSRVKLVTIVFNRFADTAKSTDWLKTLMLSLTVSIVSFLILNRSQEDSGLLSEFNQKDLSKNIEILSSQVNRVNPFLLPAGVLLILTGAFITGNFTLAEKMSVNLWLALLVSILLYILQKLRFKKFDKLKDAFEKLTSNTISTLDDMCRSKTLIIVGVLLIFVSGLSKIYYMGGDDSRIFYMYPLEFLTNYSSKIVSDTGVSQLTNSIPPGSLSAFVIFLIGLKSIFPIFNLQAMLDTANLIGGFLSFYYLLKYLLKPQEKYTRVICVLASFMYVFSIFNFYTLLNSRLIAQYLISLFPISVYLAIRAIREGKFYLLVFVAIIWSVFSLISVTLPLSGAALITLVPLLILLSWGHLRRLLVYLVCTSIILLLLNIHWLAFIPYTNFSNSVPGSNAPSITSKEFRKQNEDGIKAVSEINSSFFPLLNSYHQKIQYNFNWPQLPIYNSWYAKYIPLGYLFIAIVIWAGIKVDKDKQRKSLYIASVAGFGLAVYFFTVDIGPFGVWLFVWLSDHIPGFVIFRNMYDKFAFGLSFQWALIIAVSLSILSKSINTEKYKIHLLFFVLLVVILNAKPFILGEFEELPYWTTRYSRDGISSFNKDYVELLNFVKTQNTTGRYLSLPLLTGNSVAIEDQEMKNNYYAGVSPLLLLTGKNDLSGLISFSEKHNQVYTWIKEKKYTEFGKLLQQLNTKYVIVNNSVSTDLQSSFMFSEGLYHIQTPEFIKSMIGKKIRDFGSKYSLYEISPEFNSEKIYISESAKIFTTDKSQVSFNKLATERYDINISHLDSPQSLFFLDPYLKGWQLRSSSGKLVSADRHELVLDYANAWYLDPVKIKLDLPSSDYQINPNGGIDLKLSLYFQPHKYYLPVNIISAVAYLLCLGFVVRSYFRRAEK